MLIDTGNESQRKGSDQNHQIGAGSRILSGAILVIKRDQLGFESDWECDTGSRWSVVMVELALKR